MKHDLTERYIYAVTKRLPAKSRNDVSSEIRTLIEDMLEERCGDITPTEKDITVVLAELGTPLELFEEYNADGKKVLIGPPYYSPYIFVLKIVFGSFLIGMIVLGVIKSTFLLSQLSDPSFAVDTTVAFLAEFVINSISGLISAFGFVTLIFMIFQHFKLDVIPTTSLKDLPPVPKKKELLSKGEAIFEIIATVVFTILILTTPSLLIFEFTTDGVSTGPLSVFNVDVIRDSSYLIILLAITTIIPQIINLIEGVYNKKTMMATILFNSTSAILVSVWLLNYTIINPMFAGAGMLFGQRVNGNLADIGPYWQHILLGIMLFLIVIDTLVVIYKSTRKKY